MIREAAARSGLLLRGAFAPDEKDGVPGLPCGGRAQALLLFGNTGHSMWQAFSASPEFGDGAPDPLDRWCRRVGEALAGRFGGMALFPFGGPPHHPFQRWALKAEPAAPSPVGMLIHPQYGLWHAYRFAIVFKDRVASSAPVRVEPPCTQCSARPCLSACPAGAFTGTAYEVRNCVAYLRATPQASCWTSGCRARHACPAGQAYRYAEPQAAFHMRAFVIRHAGEP